MDDLRVVRNRTSLHEGGSTFDHRDAIMHPTLFPSAQLERELVCAVIFYILSPSFHGRAYQAHSVHGANHHALHQGAEHLKFLPVAQAEGI